MFRQICSRLKPKDSAWSKGYSGRLWRIIQFLRAGWFLQRTLGGMQQPFKAVRST